MTIDVPKFKVISQTPALVKDVQGQYEQGWRVTAQLIPSGTVFSVDVPQARYNAESVKDALITQARHVESIDNLET